MSNIWRIKNNLLLGLCFSIWMISCQSSTSPEIKIEPIQAEVYLRYLETEQQIKSEISFATIDSTKKVIPTKMEEVLFQKTAMDGKKIRNSFRYQFRQIAAFTRQYNFEFNKDGQDYPTQTIEINPIEDYFIKGDIISKSTKNTLVFKGKLLKANESLILLFSDENNVVETVAIAGPSSDLGVTLYPEQLKDLKLGKGKLYLVRKQRIEEKRGDFNLTGLTEYYTKVIEIEVVE